MRHLTGTFVGAVGRSGLGFLQFLSRFPAPKTPGVCGDVGPSVSHESKPAQTREPASSHLKQRLELSPP